MLRKLFRATKLGRWQIHEKETIDEIIFRTTKVRNRLMLELTPTLDIEQIFTNLNNPKGNAETERLMRTLKEELLWLEEFAGLEEAREKLSAWIDFYNKDCLHSALGYKSPQEYERLYQEANLEKAA